MDISRYMNYKRWLPVIGYIFVVMIVFGGAFFSKSGQMIFGDDIARYYFFNRAYVQQTIASGEFPWWNPYLMGGGPFMANPFTNMWYPPNWLFVFFPVSSVYAWLLAFHIFWAMLGMYLLLKQIRPTGAFVGGLIFGLSGFFMARVWSGHMDLIASASWMPWVVWGCNRKKMALVACMFALQLLAGYQTMALFTGIIVGIFSLIQSIFHRTWFPLFFALSSLFLGLALAAIQIVPVQEFFLQTIRTYDLPYAWHEYGAIEWRSLLQLFNPFQFGNQYTYNGPPPNFGEQSMFVGIGGVILAIIGVLRVVRERREVWGKLFLIVAIFGFWVSLGNNAPFDLQYVLWKFVPMYHYIRIPSRHLIFVIFGLAGLAGIGFERIHRSLKVLILGIIIIEMVWFARNFVTLSDIPGSRHDNALISLLQKGSQPYRTLENFGAWILPRDSLDFSSLQTYKIFGASGYDPAIMRSYYEYIARKLGKNGRDLMQQHDVQIPYLSPYDALLLDRLNIKYILVPIDGDVFAGNSRYHNVQEDMLRGWRVYENTTVKSRYFLRDDTCGTVQVTKYTSNTVMANIDATCDTHVDSSEIWYPGWVAHIDGKKVQINKLDDTFRTIFISSGKHTIVYQYTPTIFFIGAGISLATLLGIIFLSNKG